MRAEYVNSFIVALKSIVEQTLGSQLTLGKPEVNSKQSIVMPVAILIGLTRGIKGQVAISMEKNTALAIANTMIGSNNFTSLNDMTLSALGEMSNWIMGRASTNLSSQGISADITPPTILTGDNMRLNSLKSNCITIPFASSVGSILLDIAVD